MPASTASPVIVVELKPKGGLLPTCATIHPSNAAKLERSRYQLHQKLKLEQGDISAISDYDPLDLFSSDAKRQTHALLAMLHTPQNNATVFVDGSRSSVWAQAPAAGKQASELSDSLTHALSAIWPDDSTAEEQLKTLAQALLVVLRASGVLTGVLAAQRLGDVDIEGVHAAYQHALFHLEALPGAPVESERVCADPSTCPVVIASPAQQQRRGTSEAWLAAHTHLQTLTWQQMVALVRDYMVAVAAKDCSVMIALSRANDDACAQPSPCPDCALPQLGKPYDGVGKCRACDAMCRYAVESCVSGDVALDTCGQEHTCTGCASVRGCSLLYRVGVVDLDCKPLSKIEKHFDLDRRILAAAKRAGV